LRYVLNESGRPLI